MKITEIQKEKLESAVICRIQFELIDLEDEVDISHNELLTKLKARYSQVNENITKKELVKFLSRHLEIAQKYGRGFAEYLLNNDDAQEWIDEYTRDLEDWQNCIEFQEDLEHYLTSLQMKIKKTDNDLTYFNVLCV